METGAQDIGEAHVGYPEDRSELHLSRFFPTIYRHYDLRFVYQAPELRSRTGRKSWDEDSPALKDWRMPDYEPRTSEESNDD